ncbi:MAG TPA: hypothetical protein VMA83_06220 [Solirubrobacteraceae bacterium]|nr:hypothetical protein [Solirubrobacteraceae bacterium]
MRPARTVVLTALAAIAVLAASAASAFATNLYVSTSGSDSNSCTSAASPCLTIQKAVEDARATPGTPTVFVAAGTYNGSVSLGSNVDEGTAIVGAGRSATILTNTATEPTVKSGELIGFRLENLTVKHETADGAPAVSDQGGPLTLKNVDVSATGTSGETAVDVEDEFLEAPVSITNTQISDGAPAGRAIEATSAPLAVSGSTVETTANKGVVLGADVAPLSVTNSTLVERGSQGKVLEDEFGAVKISRSTVELPSPETTGLLDDFGSLVVTGSHVIQRANEQVAVVSEEGTPVLEHDTFEVLGAGTLVEAEGAHLSMTSDTVHLDDASATGTLIQLEGPGATLRKVNVSGPWDGAIIEGFASGRVSILESDINDASDEKLPVVIEQTLGSTRFPLLVQRSHLISAPAAPDVIDEIGTGSLALDSSLIQGGVSAVRFIDLAGAKIEPAVISGSTIDAGTPGLSGEAGVTSITAELLGPDQALNADVEGSVLFEPMTATLGGAVGLAVSCQNTDAPSQSQAASATEGAISCRSGVHGNENLPSPSSIFASPITSYVPKKRGRLVDSVPSDTISIGYGIKPAPYDLAGHKRDEYGRFGRKCELVQDRGALQMSGQKATCKPKKRKRRRR